MRYARHINVDDTYQPVPQTKQFCLRIALTLANFCITVGYLTLAITEQVIAEVRGALDRAGLGSAGNPR